jgi:hypothetical protein
MEVSIELQVAFSGLRILRHQPKKDPSKIYENIRPKGRDITNFDHTIATNNRSLLYLLTMKVVVIAFLFLLAYASAFVTHVPSSRTRCISVHQ